MRFVLSLFVCIFILSGSMSAYAGGWPWANLKYAHYADNEPIQELLQQFASSINTPITISEKVQGAVSGKFEEATAREFIDRLSRIHSLLWYYDGQVLYVYHSSEVETALINLQSASPERLVNALAHLGVLDRRFALKTISNEGIVMLSGPPRYAQLVREVADIILSGQIEQTNDAFVVKVFELKYAWADDRNIRINGRTINAPGVASTLRSVLGRDTPEPTDTSEVAFETLPKLKGQGLARGRYGSNDAQDDFSPAPRERAMPVKGSAAYVVANERLNAVIVHDRYSRIPLYQELIRSLDKPQSQVEIEVSIIDVSTDRLGEMGLEWQVSGSKGSLTTGDFSNGALPRDANELSLIVGNNANFSTLLNSTQDFFLTRIRALSEEGDANVLSQPTILTLDNNEAVLDHSTTFYVRLTGDREVDLFPVSVGSVLRVTPHIVSEVGGNKIHLDINIEDGQQTDQTVDDIPTISKSVINTQALINENGSLLIGGYYYNQDSTASRKVPFLGDLPVLGHLFRTDGSKAQKKARLFLISPKIVATEDGDALSKNVESLLEEYKERRSIGSAIEISDSHLRALY